MERRWWCQLWSTQQWWGLGCGSWRKSRIIVEKSVKLQTCTPLLSKLHCSHCVTRMDTLSSESLILIMFPGYLKTIMMMYLVGLWLEWVIPFNCWKARFQQLPCQISPWTAMLPSTVKISVFKKSLCLLVKKLRIFQAYLMSLNRVPHGQMLQT